MNQSLFKPRILVLATALAAGAAIAQSTGATPSSMSYPACANLQGVALSDCLRQHPGASSHPDTASLPSKNPDRPASLSADSVGSGGDRMNYGTPNSAPTAGSTAALDRSTSANTGTSTTYHDSSASSSAPIVGSSASRANDSTQQSTSSSATNPTGAPPGTSTYSSPATATGTTSRNDSTQMSTSSSATNPTGANADTRATFRAMLRNCVQLIGDARDSCIDRAVDAYPQS